ncbi:MAG: response regulator transcription factor [Deinococcales bacterium]
MTAAPRPSRGAARADARVLIVEDESALADVLADNLRDEGLAVSTAGDGTAGERLWAEERPDLKALLRRRGWSKEAPRAGFHFAGHFVDYRSWTAELAGGGREPLGEREFRIFRVLAERQGEVVSRDDILDAVWGDDAFPSSRTVDNFVLRLRKLFEPDPSAPRYFHTVWGVGYRFTPDGEAEETL